MAGNGNQGHGSAIGRARLGALDYGKRTSQTPSHVLNEPGLATARGPLQEHRQLLLVRSFKKLYFIR